MLSSNYSHKDKQFLKLCVEGAKIFSTCSKRQYMAVLVDENNHVVGLGYNGGPKAAPHCTDGGCPRAQAGSQPGSSYDNCIAIHAEANAFLHSDYGKATSVYINGLPCFSCAKLIVNSGIKKVCVMSDPDYVYPNWLEVAEFMVDNGVEEVLETQERFL